MLSSIWRAGFKFHRVMDIKDEKITAYADNRLEAGAERSSVNRELAHLRHGFNLMLKKKMISSVPLINLFEGENVRKGFIGVGGVQCATGKDHRHGRERHDRVSV